MKVFLTGATGFIGQALTRELLGRGWQVTAVVRRPDSPAAGAIAALGAVLVAGDVTERESLRAGMAGTDLVFHNAGHYEYGLDAAGRERMHAINVRGTEHVLGMAEELRIGRVVYVSTVGAFGETGPTARDETFERQQPCRTWYEQTKTDAHQIALRYQRRGLPLVIACPSQVIGPNDHSVFGYLLRLYLNRMLPPFAWNPEVRIAMTYIDDIAAGMGLVAAKGRVGETYLLCDEAKTLREHLGLWRSWPGGSRLQLWLPAGLMAASLWPLEPLQRMAGLPAFLSRETVQASINLNYTGAKARAELGWRARGTRQMWEDTVNGERARMAQRSGHSLLDRIRHRP